MRLRQVVLVAAELEPAAAVLRRLFRLGPGYRDPGVGEFGLENVVYAAGDTFLEIVSPRAGDTAAGRYLERRGGDGGYMVILQVEDLDELRRHLDEVRVRTVWRSDHEDIKASHLHPRDVGGAILSLDQPTPPESWRWAGPRWVEEGRRAAVGEVTGVEIQSESPGDLAGRWGEVLRRAVEPCGDGWRLPLARGEIRFVPPRDDRGEGVCGFDLEVCDPVYVERERKALGLERVDGALECCGVRFVLR
ncbi:MAG TPA: hypothetical protein VMV46_05525 [Thermoanaerobaculia bacterium]|nr:hypothetical protein [Thermoanaerobaculia bacterium]